MFIILVLVIILLIIIISQYNNLVRLEKRVKQAESGIDVYLKQRFDLIPNLVECVKGYSKHEKEIFENITNLRNAYMQNKNLEKGQELNNNINKIMAIAENYPDLKASEQYLNLQKQLTKIESQLQAARRIYNMEVTKYNTKISVIPSNIIASVFNFKEASLFEIEELKKENINIDL